MKPDLGNARAVKRFLADHPESIGHLARKFDVPYVHELTHANQNQLWSDFWLGSIKALANGLRYPIESEYQAYWMRNRYLYEKMKADPAMAGMFCGDTANTLGRNLLEYASSLKQYRDRMRKLPTYKGKVASIDKMRMHSQAEKNYYRKAMTQEEEEWPRLSAEIKAMVARCRKSRSSSP
jgi:hypothetical protein